MSQGEFGECIEGTMETVSQISLPTEGGLCAYTTLRPFLNLLHADGAASSESGLQLAVNAVLPNGSVHFLGTPRLTVQQAT